MTSHTRNCQFAVFFFLGQNLRVFTLKLIGKSPPGKFEMKKDSPGLAAGQPLSGPSNVEGSANWSVYN